MPPFNIGDKVICLSHDFPFSPGDIATVSSTRGNGVFYVANQHKRVL